MNPKIPNCAITWTPAPDRAQQEWEHAIEIYSKLIALQPTNGILLSRRAEAYCAAGQRDSAKADWLRMLGRNPALAQAEYDRFRFNLRWKEAADLGVLLIEQNPNVESWRWLKLAPILALAGDKQAYKGFCARMKQQFAGSSVLEDGERTVKSSLLLPIDIEVNDLPHKIAFGTLDIGTAPESFQSWGWGTRALFAYRSNDFESAVKYINRSEEFRPSHELHATNLAILALAQHRQQNSDKAKAALEEATKIIRRLEAAANNKIEHDLLIAGILRLEAEVAIHPLPEPKSAPER